MARTNVDKLIHQFVLKQLTDLELKLNQCNVELVAQSLTCPTLTLSPLDMIDSSLELFVQSYYKHRSNQINYLLTKHKDKVSQQQLWKGLLEYCPTVDQV
jgi:hypothetical protein